MPMWATRAEGTRSSMPSRRPLPARRIKANTGFLPFGRGASRAGGAFPRVVPAESCSAGGGLPKVAAMKRAILLVMDSFGIGGAEDADRFGDAGSDTLGHIAAACAASAGDRAGLR